MAIRQDRSYRGKPPLWELYVHEETGLVRVHCTPDLFALPENRREIDHLTSVLQMYLHELARSRQTEER